MTKKVPEIDVAFGLLTVGVGRKQLREALRTGRRITIELTADIVSAWGRESDDDTQEFAIRLTEKPILRDVTLKKTDWECPVGRADCTHNCGSYVCGN